MARGKIYVALEIGTSKISVVIGEVRPDGGIKILGIGQAPSRGVRKGEIVDFQETKAALNKALAMAEERSAMEVKEVFLAISGGHIGSLNQRVAMTIPEVQGEVVAADLEELRESGRDVGIPATQAFIHTILRNYRVDGEGGILNPLGMTASELEAEYHLIHGSRLAIQNAIRCVREIPLGVEDIVFAPLASAQVLLNRAHREKGAVLVDMGGGTTDYALFREGSLAASGSLGVGGDHVTNDLAQVLCLPLQTAENLKTQRGAVYFDSSSRGERISVPSFENKVQEIDLNQVNHIIHLRIRETFELIRDDLESTVGLEGLGAGVFLTGGGSLLTGVSDLAQAIFQAPVQRGGAAKLSGTRATFENPQYATCIGLIRFAQLLDEDAAGSGASGSLGQKIGGWLGMAS